ncbi:NADH:ubiquinone oxidoreductase subunit 5 (subunit L)/multisubunit Na+/H+ antiporter MnhA subunit [Salinibacterium sp. CAN_S4]|uniref:proton-conducting transporter transmembrane domain-containing protein n=1 Tax=Salinibacterium sp. CAN_S4 TaxID=2787727 RepID=UPI0018F0299F
MSELILALMLALPWATVVIAASLGQRSFSPNLVARVAAGLTGAGFVLATGAAISVGRTGPMNVELGTSSVQLDPLSVVLSMLVLGLSAVIQSFAVRYLRGDRRQRWFVVSATALTAATVLLVCAASVVVFAVAWVTAGAALVAALATYPELAQAREGVRRTALRFAIADAGLLVAVGVLVVAGGGDQPLSELGSIARSLAEPLGPTVAVLLVIAALAHSSQLPFHGWLPFTLAAPTPVSALMHAGVVNAGAILLVRFSPVISAYEWLMIAIMLIGAATLVWASAARLVRPDVKGRLVYSTMAQMGFMIMACGLGAYAAAIFHLIAHSLFKSSLFLGAGLGVRRYLADANRPAGKPANGAQRVLAVLLAIVVPVASVVVAEALLASSISPASLALLAFVTATGVITLAAALIGRFTLRTLLIGSVGIFSLIFAYVGFLDAFSVALSPVAASAPAPAWLVTIPAAALLTLDLLARGRMTSWLGDRVYARALTATTPRLSPTKGLPR